MADDLRTSLKEIIADEAPIDLTACYEGTVVQQRADGTMDVKVDDARFGEGLVGVPYRSGLPGMTCTVPKGTRVAVGFENLRRDCPVVRYFESGTPLTLVFDVSSKVTVQSAGDVEVTAGGSAKVAATGDAEVTSASGDVKVEATAGDIDVKATVGNITVEAGPAGIIKLGGAAAIKPIARVGDMAGPYPIAPPGCIQVLVP
jgi:hypothetical protein